MAVFGAFLIEWRLIVSLGRRIVLKTSDYPPLIFEMHILPPQVGLVVSAGGDRRARRGERILSRGEKPPAGAPVTRGGYGEVVERITEEVVLGRVAMIACILWAKCGHHPSFSWPMPRWAWHSSNRNRARVDIPLCTSATTAGYARFPALIVH